MTERINKYLRWIITIAYALGILYVSTRQLSGPQLFPHVDKVIHFVMYGGLAFLCAGALFHTVSIGWRAITIISVSIATVYGIFNEILQMYVPTRSTDIIDALANCAGAVVGAYLAKYVQRTHGEEMIKQAAQGKYEDER
jgi:VanZ family protein